MRHKSKDLSGYRRRENFSEFRKLKELGFRFGPFPDGYSDQPDSGGAIGGIRGAQEYGISGGIASEEGLRDQLSGLEQANMGRISEWSTVPGRDEEGMNPDIATRKKRFHRKIK